ncbi:MAG: porin, partial [Pseudomonadota bacterium]
TLGDTDDAFDKALQEVGALTSLTDDHTTHAGYSFNGGGNSFSTFAGLEGIASGFAGYEEEFVLRYDYSFDALTLSLSIEQGVDNSVSDIDDTYSIGVAYDADLGGVALGIGLGYSANDTDFGTGDAEAYGISLDAEIGGIEVVLNYSQTETGTLEIDHYGIGVTYTVDALSLHANYGVFDLETPGSSAEVSGFGLAVNYDLGGGAVVMFGYGSSDVSEVGSDDYETASFGLGLSF